MLIGEVLPLETYTIMLSALQEEKNELIANYLSGSIQNIYWKFLTLNQQKEIQITTETKLLKLLESDLPSNLKKTIFNSYQSLAISKEGKDNLYEIWSQEKTFKNLFLNENNFIALAMQLAIFKHDKASEILEKQQGRISNPDRLERFKWLLPSLSSNQKERDDFMKLLLLKENREKESWVLTGLNNIHHPLRQASAIKHLKSILDRLEEVQLTGDIFLLQKEFIAKITSNN